MDKVQPLRVPFEFRFKSKIYDRLIVLVPCSDRTREAVHWRMGPSRLQFARNDFFESATPEHLWQCTSNTTRDDEWDGC
jgi:hypothetical protein